MALSGIVKGCSSDPILEKVIGHFWLMCWKLQARVWIEYIDSYSNWADGISRNFGDDEFVKKEGILIYEVVDPLHVLRSEAPDLFACEDVCAPGEEPYG